MEPGSSSHTRGFGIAMQQRRLGQQGPSVSALGFGGMLLSISGRPPADQAAITISAALEAGINWIDSADAYCLDDTEFNHNEELLRRILGPKRRDILIATKCGCLRPGGAWTVDAHPEVLRNAAHASLKALGLEALPLLQLHGPDSRVPFTESVGALARLREEGKVIHIGISNVTVAQIVEACGVTPIASVQHRYNVSDRRAEHNGVLEHCARQGIAFIAYSPFGGTLGAPILPTHGKLAEFARRRRVSPYRLMLAWMLAKSPWLIPVVGSRRPESIRDSARAAALSLEPREIQQIEETLNAPATPPPPPPPPPPP